MPTRGWGTRKGIGCLFAASALSAAIGSTARTGRAEPYGITADGVSADGKGIAGGALLGAEVGLVTLAAAGVHRGWAYALVPGALAIGGGVGGYFIERSSSVSPELPVGLLVAGMALAIPSVVFTLSATAYRPADEGVVTLDSAPESRPMQTGVSGSATLPASPPSSGGSTSGGASGAFRRSLPATSPRTGALISLQSLDAVEFGLPVVRVRGAYNREEMAQFGLSQHYEVHAPVVAMTF